MRRQFRLSPAQHYHWDLTRDGEHASDINIVLAVFLGRQPDPSTTAQRLQAAVGRHAVLRTLYSDPEADGQAIQVFDDNHQINVTYVDAEASAGADVPLDFEAWFGRRSAGPSMTRAVAEAILAQKAHRYDLSLELPSRIILIGDEAHLATAVLGFHHAAIDAHALGVLLADIRDAFQTGVFDPITDFRYLEYAELKAQAYAERYDRQISYWARRLHATGKESAHSFLTRRPKPCQLEMRVLQTDDAEYQSGVEGMSVAQATHVAALAQGLRAAGRLDRTHILGTTANRVSASEQNIVGCFYKHLIWILPGPDETSVEDLTRYLALQGLRSYQNIDVTLADILREHQAATGGYPTLDAQITVRDLRGLQAAASGPEIIEAAPFLASPIEERISMHLHVSVEENRVSAGLVYDPDAVDPAAAVVIMDEIAGFYCDGA